MHCWTLARFCQQRQKCLTNQRRSKSMPHGKTNMTWHLTCWRKVLISCTCSRVCPKDFSTVMLSSPDPTKRAISIFLLVGKYFSCCIKGKYDGKHLCHAWSAAPASTTAMLVTVSWHQPTSEQLDEMHAKINAICQHSSTYYAHCKMQLPKNASLHYSKCIMLSF